MRFLDKFKLFVYDLELALHLLALLQQRLSLFICRAKLLVSRMEFGFQQLLFLLQLTHFSFELVDGVGELIIVSLHDHVKVLFLQSLLLEGIISGSIRLIFLHHNVVVAL